MQDDAKKAEKDIKDQIKEYRKLQAISNSAEFNDYFNNQIKIVTDKLIWGFGTHQKKLGTDSKGKVVTESIDNIQNWDDFCKWRGEIIARIQPIQEIYSAQNMIDYLNQQLAIYYKNNNQA